MFSLDQRRNNGWGGSTGKIPEASIFKRVQPTFACIVKVSTPNWKKRQMENEDDKQHLLLNELHDSTALQFNQVNQSHQGSSKRLECSITRYRTFNPQNFSTQLETKNSIFDDAIYGEYSDLITAPLNANRKLH